MRVPKGKSTGSLPLARAIPYLPREPKAPPSAIAMIVFIIFDIEQNLNPLLQRVLTIQV